MAKVYDVTLQVIVDDEVEYDKLEEEIENFFSERIWETTFIVASLNGTIEDTEDEDSDNRPG